MLYVVAMSACPMMYLSLTGPMPFLTMRVAKLSSSPTPTFKTNFTYLYEKTRARRVLMANAVLASFACFNYRPETLLWFVSRMLRSASILSR